VKAGATVCTDALMSYDDLEKDYDRQIVDHLECYARGQVHTNGLENFWSLLKRALKGTYVNVEPFHLFRYLDEQAFRFNERKLTDSRAIFSRRSLDSRTALDVSRANRQCGSKLNIASATRQTRRTIMPEPETPDPIKVQVHQRKAALFRVVQADGVWTSVNPWGNLHLTFYSERAPIPTSVYFGPNKDGIWEELVDLREGKKGWFRELEVDVVLTPVAARSVLDTLQRYLEPTQPPSAQTNISTPETK